MNERVTPDGRYFEVRGRLWRRTNTNLPLERREALRSELMTARRAVNAALKSGKPDELALTRKVVDTAKVALGERGPVWWTMARRISTGTKWQAALTPSVGPITPDKP